MKKSKKLLFWQTKRKIKEVSAKEKILEWKILLQRAQF